MRREMKKIAVSVIMLLAALFCVSCSDVNEYPEKPSKQQNGHKAV